MAGPASRDAVFTMGPRLTGVDQSENFGVSAPTSDANTTTSMQAKLTADTFLPNFFMSPPSSRPRMRVSSNVCQLGRPALGQGRDAGVSLQQVSPRRCAQVRSFHHFQIP